MKIREALRLREKGLSNSQISLSPTAGMARSTVVELFKRCDSAKITYENSQEMSDRELETFLYPRKALGKREKQELNEAYWLQRISESKKQIMSVWQDEYLVQNPGGLSYAQFSNRLRKWEGEHNPKVYYPKNRKAGEIMETDWCGDVVPLLYNKTVEIFEKVHFFVASLGFSQMIFARAYLDEKEAAWLDGHTRALEFFGALPEVVTPDNAKTGVTKAHHYDPLKNPSFAQWAAYYGLAIIPARPYKPTDKDRVESSVNTFQSKILPKLKEQVFFDLDSINLFIHKELKVINERPYQKRPGSRASIFREVDLPAMRPLPPHRYENPETKWVIASRNGYHIQYDDHQYSVPFQLAGQKILLSATSTKVEFHFDNKLVALHQRCYSRQQIYVTDPNHMPKKHQAQLEEDNMTGEKYLKWAERIGPCTRQVIETLLLRYEQEQQSYRTCMGILRMAEKHSEPVLEKACEKACETGIAGYKQIESLVGKLTGSTTKKTNNHANLRGGEYYKGR